MERENFLTVAEFSAIVPFALIEARGLWDFEVSVNFSNAKRSSNCLIDLSTCQ